MPAALTPFRILAGFSGLGCVCRLQILARASPVPSSSECPACFRGEFRCPFSECDPHFSLPGLETDFQDVQLNCFQEVVDGHTVQLDVDYQCQYTAPGAHAVSCLNMHDFQFEGISMLHRCEPTSNAGHDLVNESCGWVCKDQRPFMRCRWTFDPSNAMAAIGGSLDKCWLNRQCVKHEVTDAYHVEVEGVCRPQSDWLQLANPAADVARARAQLAEALEDHVKASQELTNALSSSGGGTSDEVALARQKFEESEQAVEAVVSSLKDLLRPLSEDVQSASSIGKAYQRVLQRQVEQQLAELITDLNGTLAELDTASSAHSATEEELQAALHAHQELQASMNEMQDELDSYKEENSRADTSFYIVLAILGIVVLFGSGSVAFYYKRLRRKWEGFLRYDGAPVVAANGGLMVVGRPVGGASERDGGRRRDGKEEKRGGKREGKSKGGSSGSDRSDPDGEHDESPPSKGVGSKLDSPDGPWDGLHGFHRDDFEPELPDPPKAKHGWTP